MSKFASLKKICMVARFVVRFRVKVFRNDKVALGIRGFIAVNLSFEFKVMKARPEFENKPGMLGSHSSCKQM